MAVAAGARISLQRAVEQRPEVRFIGGSTPVDTGILGG
jgi:hypothetical protein